MYHKKYVSPILLVIFILTIIFISDVTCTKIIGTKTITNRHGQRGKVAIVAPLRNQKKKKELVFGNYIPVSILVQFETILLDNDKEPLKMGAVLPVSFADVKIQLNCDNCYLVESPTTLDRNGYWNGVIRVNWPRTKFEDIEIVMTVYPTGKYAYVYQEENPDTERFDTEIDSSEDLRVTFYTFSYSERLRSNFRGSLSHTKTLNGLTTIQIPRRTVSNGPLLAYAVITRTALHVVEEFKVDGIKMLILAINDPKPVDVDGETQKISQTYCLPDLAVMLVGSDMIWSASVLLHEYGHYVQHLLYNEKGEWLIPDTSDHNSCDDVLEDLEDIKEQDSSEWLELKKLAWSEGYASGFGSILMAEFNLGIPGFESDINLATGKFMQFDIVEEPRYVEHYFCKHPTLEEDEGRITALLYDLYDDIGGDDNLNNAPQLKTYQVKDEDDEEDDGDDNGLEKIDVPVEWFGRSGPGDRNSGKRLTAKEILVDFIKLTPQAKDQTLKEYLMVIKNQLKKSEKLPLVSEIVEYNYGTMPTNDGGMIHNIKS